MKTKKLFIISACILLLAYQNVVAQNPQIQTGTTVHYSVTPVVGSDVTSYTWTLTGGASGFLPSLTNTQDVTWNVIGNNYVLSVTPKSSHNCTGVPQTLTVDVVAVLARTISWAVPAVGICSGDNFVSSVTVTGSAPASWSFSYTVDADPTVLTSPALTPGSNTSAVTLGAFTNPSNTADAPHTIHITSVTVDGVTYLPASSVDKGFTVFMVPAVGSIQF